MTELCGKEETLGTGQIGSGAEQEVDCSLTLKYFEAWSEDDYTVLESATPESPDDIITDMSISLTEGGYYVAQFSCYFNTEDTTYPDLHVAIYKDTTMLDSSYKIQSTRAKNERCIVFTITEKIAISDLGATMTVKANYFTASAGLIEIKNRIFQIFKVGELT